MGQSEVLLRTYWGTHWELENHVRKPIEILREYIENLMGTHWEQMDQNTPLDPPQKKKKLALLGVCYNSALDEQNFYC